MRTLCLVLLAFIVALHATTPSIYAYVGRITPDSFLLAWGTAEGDGNTIGRASASLGGGVVAVNDRQFLTQSNWVEVTGLDSDHDYPYSVVVNGQEIAKGHIRTYPRVADRLSFFVIGDYGTGKTPQYEIAAAMMRELEKKRASDSPVRFVLTTGDNVYAGGQDRDWKAKFFEPYKQLIREIPFYPSVGNHDRQAASNSPGGELRTYMDNFFLPADELTPYYAFSFGALVDFFALDTTNLSKKAALNASLVKGGGQLLWLEDSLQRAKDPWKIAYFHHPPFTAGPNHKPSLDQLTSVVDLFKKSMVQVVFSGHEHNFQFTEQTQVTGKTLYVVSGAGGELRNGEIYSKMASAGIAGTAPQHHFLLVEVDREKLTITPLSSEPVSVEDANRRPVSLPIVVDVVAQQERRNHD